MTAATAVPAVVTALGCGLLGLLVPMLIGRIPEPPEPEEGKESYAAIALRRGVRIGAPLAGLLVGAVLGGWLGWQWQLAVLVPLVPIGTALAVIDWRTRLLPTKVIAPTYALVLALLLAGWAVTGSADDLVRAGLGWFVAGGSFLVLWLVYPQGLGYGDVRLSGVLGLALGQLGWAELVTGLYAGFLLGAVLGSLLALLRWVDRSGYPFGPFMLAGALFGVLGGESVVAWLWG